MTDDEELRSFLEEVYARYHYDFRNYAIASMRRRFAAAQIQFRCDSLRELRDRVIDHPDAFSALLQHLTVQVSDMFRDPAFYLAFRQQIVPVLATYPSLKIWIAGCSSGEELYSMAILLKEEGLLDRTMFYATDVNPLALRKAEAGIYPLERLALYTANHQAAGGKTSLSQHYSTAYGKGIFDRSLCKNVVFSDHSLATDSVFAEVHVVTCRNVLIYFDRTLQTRVVGTLKDSLIRRGFLGLGAKESLQFSGHAEDFRSVAPQEKWYQKC